MQNGASVRFSPTGGLSFREEVEKQALIGRTAFLLLLLAFFPLHYSRSLDKGCQKNQMRRCKYLNLSKRVVDHLKTYFM
jgi:hypothetical protein